ncbi:MAG: polysaccharide deacetylase family protein [Verrucomicrobiota bacterium]
MMSRFVFVLSLCVLTLAGCKKSQPQPAGVPATPAPTPAPTAEPTPTPEPIDLTAKVVVLCYHRFEEKGGREMVSTPAEFEAQLQALKDNGISVIPMGDFLAWRRGEKNIPAKSAVITLDDGWLTGYTTAWPLLKKSGYPFTMFIYTDYVKGGPKSGGQSMTWEQLAEMRDAGVDIASHTVTHTGLNARKGKTDAQYREWLKSEIAGSKQILEDKLGIQVKTIAYPYGLHNDVVREVVKEAGYEGGFTVYGQHLGNGGDPALLGRYALDSKNSAVFTKGVLNFSGASSAPSATTIMPAAATMMTLPADGETISDPAPELKINLAAFGVVDPKSVTMRLSGLGQVPATYDPATQLLSYKLTQKIYARQVTVIVGATANGKKVETRWSFNIGPATPQ